MSLMFTESRVLLGVLERLMARGIVALPMHDGLLIAQSDQEIAKSLMEKVAHRIVDIPMPVSVRAISPTHRGRSQSRVSL